MPNTAQKQSPQLLQFFEVRLQSVASDQPLSFDLFLSVNGKPILFRKQNDVLTSDRLESLLAHGGQKFLILEEQRQLYLDSLKALIHNPDASIEIKSKYIKESAFLHVHDLFEKPSVADNVEGARLMVSEMVDFVSEDVSAVANLMQLSKHDYYTYNHCVDVAVYCIALAKHLYGENKDKLIQAGLSGFLHDIGKRQVDTQIINKSTKLTQEEWAEMKRHPEYGELILRDVDNVPTDSKRAVYEHHENHDGTGYPNRKKGHELCELTKLVTIADVFDALTTKRSYHEAISPQDALDMMFGMQPGKFDPEVFEVFNKKFDKKTNLKLLEDFDPCHVSAIGKIAKK